MADKKQEKTKELAITSIGGIALVLVFGIVGGWGSSDIRFARELAPYVLLLGIGLLIFYQFLFVANSQIVKVFKGEFAAQAALTALIAYCLLSSSIEAASVLNRVFGVDANAFPNALRVMTFVQMFLMGKPFFWLFFAWSVVTFIYFLLDHDDVGDAWHTWMFAGSGIGVSGIALLAIHFAFEPGQQDRRAYLLARTTDFYLKANCPGLKLTGSVVFLGPEQRRVLVDTTPAPDLTWTQALMAKSDNFTQIQPPSHFPIYLCKENTL